MSNSVHVIVVDILGKEVAVDEQSILKHLSLVPELRGLKVKTSITAFYVKCDLPNVSIVHIQATNVGVELDHLPVFILNIEDIVASNDPSFPRRVLEVIAYIDDRIGGAAEPGPIAMLTARGNGYFKLHHIDLNELTEKVNDYFKVTYH